MKTRKEDGFTLFELLIVVVIIGFLALYTAYQLLSDERAKVRDARRISDLATIRSGLELYYQEHGDYPDVADIDDSCGTLPWTWDSGNTNTQNADSTSDQDFLSMLQTENLLNAIPRETRNFGSADDNCRAYGYTKRDIAPDCSPVCPAGTVWLCAGLEKSQSIYEVSDQAQCCTSGNDAGIVNDPNRYCYVLTP
ncbi:MAG: type II secretion system protein [Candidatus Wildermuthbacteria bacterium]|nr:type II secretion system protein [Candidatus Wildermuthbacteria bacterium]